MALLQMNLIDIAVSLANHLQSSTRIKNFCQTNFKKNVTILVGDITEEEVPTEDDAPYLYLYAWWKEEGKSRNKCFYHGSIGLGVNVDNANKIITETGVVVCPGHKLISDFQFLVQLEINEYSGGRRLIDNVEASLIGTLNSSASHWVANMECTWNMEQTLSYANNEKF